MGGKALFEKQNALDEAIKSAHVSAQKVQEISKDEEVLRRSNTELFELKTKIDMLEQNSYRKIINVAGMDK